MVYLHPVGCFIVILSTITFNKPLIISAYLKSYLAAFVPGICTFTLRVATSKYCHRYN